MQKGPQDEPDGRSDMAGRIDYIAAGLERPRRIRSNFPGSGTYPFQRDGWDDARGSRRAVRPALPPESEAYPGPDPGARAEGHGRGRHPPGGLRGDVAEIRGVRARHELRRLGPAHRPVPGDGLLLGPEASTRPAQRRDAGRRRRADGGAPRAGGIPFGRARRLPRRARPGGPRAPGPAVPGRRDGRGARAAVRQDRVRRLQGAEPRARPPPELHARQAERRRSGRSMNFDDVGELMEALRDGTIEDAQVARLDQLLAEHPEAVDYFADRAWLRAELEAKLGGPPGLRLPVPKARRHRGALFALAAAAAVVLAVLLAVFAKVPRGETTYEGCAILTRALDTRWEGGGPAVGSVLPRGRLAFEAGVIQVEFFSGARVILEGPADFELVSSNEGLCRFGKLRALVPPQAQGFTVRTPGIRLVDRGTEFGLRLDRSGDAEVHVFQGRVELHSQGSRSDLPVGRAVRIDPAGAARQIDANPEAFVTLSDLNVRSALEARARYARWGAASERLRRDPRIAVYYSFEDAPEWSRELRAQRPERSPLDGAIIGCRWAEGRWQGKKALEFKGPGDRVRFQDAGEYESLTLMTWVRVDALDRPFSGLMLTDGWTSGSVHWQITQHGTLRLGIHGDKQMNDYDTPVVFTPGQFGRWIHLCTVYNRDAREVLHYVDGRLANRLALKFDTQLRLGAVELGNWGVPLQGNVYAVRNLNGRMDEFALFGKALGADEIRELYSVGAPAP